MIHYMNLNNRPFQLINNGSKSVEMRLYDEKRAKIKVGDQITFTNLVDGSSLEVIVTKLSRHNSFYELYNAYDSIALGYIDGEAVNPSDMLEYYSQANIDKYGVLAITVKVK